MNLQQNPKIPIRPWVRDLGAPIPTQKSEEVAEGLWDVLLKDARTNQSDFIVQIALDLYQAGLNLGRSYGLYQAGDFFSARKCAQLAKFDIDQSIQFLNPLNKNGSQYIKVLSAAGKKLAAIAQVFKNSNKENHLKAGFNALRQLRLPTRDEEIADVRLKLEKLKAELDEHSALLEGLDQELRTELVRPAPSELLEKSVGEPDRPSQQEKGFVKNFFSRVWNSITRGAEPNG